MVAPPVVITTWPVYTTDLPKVDRRRHISHHSLGWVVRCQRKQVVWYSDCSNPKSRWSGLDQSRTGCFCGVQQNRQCLLEIKTLGCWIDWLIYIIIHRYMWSRSHKVLHVLYSSAINLRYVQEITNRIKTVGVSNDAPTVSVWIMSSDSPTVSVWVMTRQQSMCE